MLYYEIIEKVFFAFKTGFFAFFPFEFAGHSFLFYRALAT